MSTLAGPISIDWPAERGTPYRRLISRARSIPTGKTHSVTLGRMTTWESNVECDGQALTDACSSVTYYCEQPCRIAYTVGGLRLKHIPDLIVEGLDHRPWLIEFKADEDPELGDALVRSELLQQPLRDQGFNYAVVTGMTLRRDSYLVNAKTLVRHGRARAAFEDVRFAQSFFTQANPRLLADYLCTATDPRLAWSRLARLFFSGYISFDMAAPLKPKTLLSWHGCPDAARGAQWLRAAFDLTRYSS